MALGSLFITAALTLGCGYSDIVYDSILRALPERSARQYPMTAKQGETGRRFYIYSDGSWFLTFEYFSPESTEKDISCIVAKGDLPSQPDALDFLASALPEEDIGPHVERPALKLDASSALDRNRCSQDR